MKLWGWITVRIMDSNQSRKDNIMKGKYFHIWWECYIALGFWNKSVILLILPRAEFLTLWYT